MDAVFEGQTPSEHPTRGSFFVSVAAAASLRPKGERGCLLACVGAAAVAIDGPATNVEIVRCSTRARRASRRPTPKSFSAVLASPKSPHQLARRRGGSSLARGLLAGRTLARAMASSGASHELRDGVLTVPLHVLTMPEGRIAVPNTTSSLYIEIGTNAFSTWDEALLPRRPNAFLVAFEPLVDKWALLLARNTRKRVAGKLGYHHKRGVVLPFAVSDHEGLADFHVAPRDGCSSLRSMHAPRFGSWNTSWTRTQCARSIENRRVPTVTLRTVLGRWLPGWRVKRLKIDAQGEDLAVLTGAGRELHRVDEVSMETLNDDCDGMYDGQPNCSTIVATMRRLGYLTLKNCSDPKTWQKPNGLPGCEHDFLFYRPDRRPPDVADRSTRKSLRGRRST